MELTGPIVLYSRLGSDSQRHRQQQQQHNTGTTPRHQLVVLLVRDNGNERLHHSRFENRSKADG
jgi:hypothetical protein